MKELVSVIVPILNPQINPTEERILHHCLNTLEKYPIIFITYEGADLSIVKEHNEDIDVIYFPQKYFQSRAHLAALFLMEDFYDRFSWCDFLLIHELNSWIVKDELYYWCKQGYDYLKAGPVLGNDSKHLSSIFSRLKGLTNDEKQVVGRAFTNNGIYLCRIERMINSIKAKRKVVYGYRHNDNLDNADSVFWELEANRFWPHLRKPTEIVRNHFATDAANVNLKKTLPFALTGISKENIHDLPYFKSLPEAS
ncbi:DUF5672 family protein [Dyadobacter sp. CY326]|uniref:DUF5672 family protein n=1 Tax=Dyadobacter sp. CY326 TaxID=2907300 RepID=UPI001F3EB96D|nr:DUF5672 family protein [Dyadobacter sp. CY326]MCE7064439.1 hypothetical protein [Dyadobacter sp. CY326]